MVLIKYDKDDKKALVILPTPSFMQYIVSMQKYAIKDILLELPCKRNGFLPDRGMDRSLLP